MADNMKTIQLRMETIGSISKITHAMSLISLAKLETYQHRIQELQEIVRDFESMPYQEVEVTDDRPTLAVCIASDLGMASTYNQTLYRAFKTSGYDHTYWLGNQNYDRLVKDKGVTVVNEKTPSDSVNLEEVYDDLLDLQEDYRVLYAMPRLVSNELEIEWKVMNVVLKKDYQIVFEPDYETANEAFKYFYDLLTLYEAYYQSKYSENMTRRLAMEQANENADEMTENLQNRYNQLRQEKVTLEIQELAGGLI